VTLVQHFGSALNQNIHFQILFLDGVYSTGSKGLPFWSADTDDGTGTVADLGQFCGLGLSLAALALSVALVFQRCDESYAVDLICCMWIG
jgi:hypothetical protein